MKRIFQFEENDDPIDICKDNVFKAVFTKETPASREALSRLISALIGREVYIESICANEPPIDNLRDRQIRFDINCVTKNGELVNVEMSLNPVSFEPIRLEFYAGKLFAGQDIKGIDKTYNNLKQAYQIAVLAKEQFFPDKEFFHNFEYYDPINMVSLNGRTRIITLELSKLEKIVEKSVKEMSAKESWAVYFRYLTDTGKRSKINEIVKHEEGIAMASEVLMTISKDWEERMRLMSIEKNELDYQSGIAYAKQTGREEGKHEIAQKLKDRGFSTEEIMEVTGIRI